MINPIDVDYNLELKKTFSHVSLAGALLVGCMILFRSAPDPWLKSYPATWWADWLGWMAAGVLVVIVMGGLVLCK